MAAPEMLKLREISETLERIETTLAGKNRSTNETRIGALRRISEGISYIDSILEQGNMCPEMYQDYLNSLRNILLGTGGD